MRRSTLVVKDSNEVIEIPAVVSPHPKTDQHIKIVLNPADGSLEKVQIYHDGKGATPEILSVYEKLKEEIIKFGERTQKLMEKYHLEQEKKKDR